MHPKCVIDKWGWFESIGYKPHEGQRLFHKSEAQNRVASCGWGWGKSTCVARDYEPLFMSPGTRIWIVGPDYGEAAREFSIVWDDLIVKKQLPMAVKRFNVDQGKMILKTPDSCGGSVLEVKTERNPHSLEAEDVDAIIYAEAGQLKKSTYERCQGRLRIGRAEQAAAFTPEGYNWAYEELWEPAEDPDQPDWWGRRGPSWENPHVSQKWLKDMKTRLSPAMYEAKIEGRFRTHTGFVFADFDPEIHVASLEGIQRGRMLVAGVDYGYTNPTVVLDVQWNEFDQLLVLGEYYQTQVTSQEHARVIKAWEKPYKWMLDDPANRDAHEIWRKAGLPVRAVPCEVEAGNELINELLKVREDDRPGIIFDTSCVNGRREMKKYRWGPTRSDLNMKEAPVKADDHVPEALKRVVAWHCGVRSMGDIKPSTGGERAFPRRRMPRT